MPSQKGGYAVITNDWGHVSESDTYNCCHCQQIVHLAVVPILGSGQDRAFCRLCFAPTCSLKDCVQTCTPFEKQLEAMENRHRLHKAMERGYDR